MVPSAFRSVGTVNEGLMIGQYVRMVAARNTRMGTINAARFDRDHISYLFHQDSRLAETFPDAWLREAEFEECDRPSDEQVEVINRRKR